LLDNSPCGFIVIVKDNNGNHKVFGYSEQFTNQRGAYIETSEGDTGEDITGSNGSQLQLKSTDSALSLNFTGTVPE
jgi:hypothetical protein